MKTATSANVDLVLPTEKKYAHVLRLAVAGIASRLQFNWEQIEDIKLAAEEAFLLVLKAGQATQAHVTFKIGTNELKIIFVDANLGVFNIKSYQQKYSFFIMTGLMDNVDIVPRNETHFDLKLSKKIY
ncbi:hypothetical protein LCGC14_1622550 [marine sediment metagenome]|uniref:Histidine kinase/HSP90-like ATPase domain-containing protein n=1 Tax=marine sediment metagenome TaxID=412755 RepID=A0A0F9IS25_9ZZZZ